MSSAPSSKRRKAQKVWSEIFDNVNITDKQLKKDVVTWFIDAFTPAEFIKASDDLCNTFCIGCKVERWEGEIRQAISSLQTRILSPSNMKWENVPRILFGSIHKFKDIDDLPQCDDTKKEDLKSQYHNTNKIGNVGRQSILKSF